MKTVSLPQITVFDRQRKVALARAELEDSARRALLLCARERGAGLTNLAQVDVILISDRRMSELHRRFLHIDGPTDVITFQHGEIFISVETAQRQARAERTTLLYELRLYLVHGLLHLQGFDDRVPKERRRMAALQEQVLAAIAGRRSS